MQTNLFPTIPEDIQRRLNAAMTSPAMSYAARCVLSVLAHAAIGRTCAVSIADLQRHWKENGMEPWGDRAVKAAVREIIEDHQVPIGSARSGNCGYYIAVNAEEMQLIADQHLGLVKAAVRRFHCFAPKSSISRALCGQLGLTHE